MIITIGIPAGMEGWENEVYREFPLRLPMC